MGSIYKEENRVEITKEQYHANKKKFKNKIEIVAIPFKCNGSWMGWRYFVRKDILI